MPYKRTSYGRRRLRNSGASTILHRRNTDIMQSAAAKYKLTPKTVTTIPKTRKKYDSSGRIGKKRGSYTKQPKRGMPDLDNGVTELTSYADTLKLGSRKNFLSKIVRANEQINYWRFSAMNPYNSTSNSSYNIYTPNSNNSLTCGAYILQNYFENTTSNSFYPFHVYELNQAPNNVVGTYKDPNPMYELYTQNTPTALFNNSNISQNYNGARLSQGQWIQENTSGILSTASSQSVPARRELLEYVQIKLLCYGTVQTPVRYILRVFQIKEDYLAPDMLMNTFQSQYGNDYRDTATTFWLAQANQSINHPINNVQPKSANLMKLLKQWSFIIQPQLTVSEESTIPHMKKCTFYLPMSRICKYDWQDVAQVSDVQQVVPGAFAQDIGSVATHVEPKARIYFSIQATQCVQYNTASVPIPNAIPSYDILIRKKTIKLA